LLTITAAQLRSLNLTKLSKKDKPDARGEKLSKM